MSDATNRAALEAIYDCQFCDGKKKIWDIKRNKYIPCPHTLVTDKLYALLRQAEREALVNLRNKWGNPATGDYHVKWAVEHELKELDAALVALQVEEES